MMFIKYPSIRRLDTEDVEGILECPILYIEPKIDGANASIYMKDGYLQLAKRTDELKDTDKGFNGLEAHILDQSVKFTEFFKKYPDTIIYGEWLVKHTIGYYRPSAYKKFYAYDVWDRTKEQFWDTEVRCEALAEFDITQTSPIVKIIGPVISQEQIDLVHSYVDKNRFLIDEPDLFGEGIVIKAFHEDGRNFKNKFGNHGWAKIVRQEFKEKHTLAMGLEAKNLEKEPEKIFAETFVTEARVEKMKQKIMADRGTGWQSQYIGEILGRIYHDVFQEELKDFVKIQKVKEFNFNTLQKYVTFYTKKALGL